ncbi:3-oxoacyl-ACP synthase III family protein [Nonomuraea sp. SBT364]|uniref:3-oxoacyl-ACP synthase III family protein n=1 Tax=Nonomuraea sp. SBT364 TaxID=1580530 RepID=UPI001E512649|nr:ketoacyl-ACP synthase III [Nonomuraea sp. SBT364]
MISLPPGVGVLGTGAHVPEAIRTNEEVAGRAGVSAEWIAERTGVRRRHVAAPGEAASDLAAHAVRAALRSAGLRPGDLDLLILATSTPDELGPSTACRVQALLGAENAVALDVSAACAGWLFGTRVASDWLRLERPGRHAAVVGVEAYSRFLDDADRGTAVLFADGAGAAVLGTVAAGHGFGPIILGSDGTRAGDVLIPGGGSRLPASHETVERGLHRIHMDGRAVRKFILEIFPLAAAQALRESGLTRDDIALVVTHQPNPVLLRQACAEAGFAPERLVIVADRVGNIGAGALPYALADAHRQGRLRPGDHVLIVAFGAGLTWGSGVLTWSAGNPSADRGSHAAGDS